MQAHDKKHMGLPCAWCFVDLRVLRLSALVTVPVVPVMISVFVMFAVMFVVVMVMVNAEIERAGPDVAESHGVAVVL